MITPSFRDVEQISAYLDGQLSLAEKTRLETRLQADPELSSLLADLREARTFLRRTPQRRPPRNFSLTPKMAGIKPPVPRAVPALGWASAVSLLVFVLTLGTNFIGQITSAANAPMLSVAPMTSEGYGMGGGAPVTPPPSNDTAIMTPTPELLTMTAPETTQKAGIAPAQPPASSTNRPSTPVSNWVYLWLGLAGVFGTTAFVVRRINLSAFRRKTRIKRDQ